jgi:hypothetical protein
MDADLDLLLISVCCTADDLLPERPRNARRKLSDAEVVTLCVAQVLMGIPSDRRFLRARHQLGLETARRSALAEIAGYGYARSHSLCRHPKEGISAERIDWLTIGREEE